jgi:hypothetical protein
LEINENKTELVLGLRAGRVIGKSKGYPNYCVLPQTKETCAMYFEMEEYYLPVRLLCRKKASKVKTLCCIVL